MRTVADRIRIRARDVLPLSVRTALRQGYDMVEEALDRISGRRSPLVPPARLMFVGSSRREYQAVGRGWLETFVEVAALGNDEDVLDVGCGVGRIAVPLTEYLVEGTYEGFDIVRSGIAWCQDEVTSRFPNFRFRHVDLYNRQYNPAGSLSAAEFRFPYDDDSFDFAFLTSVFTHMFPGEVRNYLVELRRVLRPGGRCLITFFLLDAEADALIAAGAVRPERCFNRVCGEVNVTDAAVPEAAVAYPEAVMRRLYGEAGLRITEPILWGSWSGRRSPTSGHNQDIVVAWK